MLKFLNHLTKEEDFKLLAKKGRPAYSALFGAKVMANKLPESRFGLVISAKVSKKATVRNLIKRRLTEIIRLNLAKIKPGFDVMILVKTGAVGKKYQELEQALGELLNKGKILK